MADILKKLGQAAKDVSSKLKSLPPGGSEEQGINEYQKQADALKAQGNAKGTPEPERIGTEPMPMGRYGDRPGEKRIDTSEMTRPLGSAVPVYDNGGDVSSNWGAQIHSAISGKPAPKTEQGGSANWGAQIHDAIHGSDASGPAVAAPAMPVMPINTAAAPVFDEGGEVTAKSGGKSVEFPKEQHGDVTAKSGMTPIPLPDNSVTAKSGNTSVPLTKEDVTAKSGLHTISLYDEGGDVDVNDGKHQMAIVKEGERVLTPEENEQYKAEHPEAKGAPVGFSGMVLPNDKNVQPEWDSEHKPANKAYPGGAHMSIDNANVDEGAGDKEHFPTVMASPTSAESKDTTSLKPYGQVIEEKAKQKAAEKVQNPGFQPITSEPAETQIQPREERGTPEQREHLDNAAKDALGKGDFVGGGTAIIQKNNLPKINVDEMQTPSAFQRPGATSTAATVQGGPAAPTAPAPLAGKAAYHAKIQDYDTRYQQLMDKAAETNDPQYAEAAERVKAAKEAYQSAHPWGAAESAHPGILGHLGHIGEQILSRAPGSAPIAATIPGSEGYRAAEAAQTQAGIKEASAQNVAEQTVDAKTAKALGGTATPAQVTDYQQRIKAIAGLTPDAAKTYATVPPGTTAAELDKRFAEATKLTTMNDEQQRTATAEQDRQDRATEQKFQHEQTRQDKLSKAYYTYTTTDPKTGKTQTEMTTGDKLDQLPEDAQLLPVKDPSLLIGEARSMDAVQDSMNELHKDLHDHPEVFDNAAARSIVQTTTEQMNRASAGLLIAGTGGSVPIPSGFGDIINTALQNNTLDEKTAKAVKSYIADYKSAKDKAMVIQMMMQNGKMGRGGQQAFESIVNQLPGGSTPDSCYSYATDGIFATCNFQDEL